MGQNVTRTEGTRREAEERPIQTGARRPDPVASQLPLPYITRNRKPAASLANLHRDMPLSRPFGGITLSDWSSFHTHAHPKC